MRLSFGTLVCAFALALASCEGGGSAGNPAPAPSLPATAPSPTPGPVATALSFDPSVLELGGLEPSTCPSPPPSGTLCGPGYSADAVDPATPAAAVRFLPLGSVNGTYGTAVADPAIASATQPFLNYDGFELFGVTPLSVGTTSIRVSAPNGASAVLPVVVTTLAIRIDATQVQSFSSPLSLQIAYPGGVLKPLLGPNLAHLPEGPPVPAGTVTTILNVPAYVQTGPGTNGASGGVQHPFEPASGISYAIGFPSPNNAVAPVTITDGQANTVTVVVTPPPG